MHACRWLVDHWGSSLGMMLWMESALLCTKLNVDFAMCISTPSSMIWCEMYEISVNTFKKILNEIVRWM